MTIKTKAIAHYDFGILFDTFISEYKINRMLIPLHLN